MGSVSLIDGHIDPDTNRMTPQEAIENIDNILNSPYLYDESIDYQLTTDDIECLEMSAKALEKQIPKKPDYWGDGYDENGILIYDRAICPCCGNEDIDYPEHHCECGQALDWDEFFNI